MDARNEFEEDLAIDVNQLDVECAKQGEIYFKWSSRTIEARMVWERAKRKLEMQEAQLQIDIRDNPTTYGLTKMTEKTIDCAVKIHANYDMAWEKTARAREVWLLLDKATTSLEHKKKDLENLVYLHGQQYFAGPDTPRNLGEIWEKQKGRKEDRVNEKVATRARRRRKKKTSD